MLNKKGFTLIELLIVIAIISILAGTAIMAYIGQQKRAAQSEAKTNLMSLRLLEEQFFTENNQYAPMAPFPPSINYNATHGVADNGIEDALPGFQPGGKLGVPNFGLNFTYTLTRDMQITNVTTTPPTIAASPNPCFVAIATGVSARVQGDVFAIDCNNNKNF